MSLFVNIDPQTIIPQMISDFESKLGVTLKAGDQRREFLQGFGYVLSNVLASIEAAGENNLLAYTHGAYMDALGELVGVTRLQPEYASVTVKFTLSAAQSQDVTIPAGTRVTPDGTLFFATTEALVIASGQTNAMVSARATAAGTTYNGFTAGQIAALVDGVPYVGSVANTDTSSGGADTEGDEAYRDRIRQAPLAFSAAGPSGAYEYFALSADASVGDVYVTQLSAGTVGIYVVKTGGIIPEAGDAVLTAVLNACSDKARRPLTDTVSVLPAVAADTTVSVEYWISSDDAAKADAVKAAVEAAVSDYKLWQTKRIGRAINPDELRRRMLNAGAVRINLATPVYTELTAEKVAQFTATTVTYKGAE